MTSPNPVGEIKLPVRLVMDMSGVHRWFDDNNLPVTVEAIAAALNATQSKVGDGEHKRRVVGHVSGWQEQMSTCVCGKPWPCPDLRTQPPAGESAGESADALPSGSLDESIKSAQRQLANTPAWLKPVEREVGEVKRYDFEVDHAVDGAYRVESPTGEFVLASDYDALLARLRGSMHNADDQP